MHLSSKFPPNKYGSVSDSLDGVQQIRTTASVDEFGDFEEKKRVVKTAALTSRERKKSAARSGYIFRGTERKRRIYFCCISKEIDIDKLQNLNLGADMGLQSQIFNDEVLRLYVSQDKDVSDSDADVSKRRDTPAMTREAYVFNFGAVVFWGFRLHNIILLRNISTSRIQETHYAYEF